MKCRPKEGGVLVLMDKCAITLAPQQKWECEIVRDEFSVSRDNVSLKLTEEEFNTYFKICEVKEKC